MICASVHRKRPKVHCHGNACQPGGSRGTTSFADGDFVRDAEVQRRDRPTRGLKHLAIRVQDEVVFEAFRKSPGRGRWR